MPMLAAPCLPRVGFKLKGKGLPCSCHFLLSMHSCGKLGSIAPEPWSLQCQSWEGVQYVVREKAPWAGQVVSLATWIGRPGYSSWVPLADSRIPDSPWCKSCARCNIHEISLAAWDNRQQMKNPSPPEFRQEPSGEPPWLDRTHKPPWVDAQLTTLDLRSLSAASSWILSLAHADQRSGPGSPKHLAPEAVRKLCQQGQVKKAVEVMEVLAGVNSSSDKYLLYSVLKECVAKKDVMLANQVYALAVKMGFRSDTFLCNHFIRMYAGHGKLQEAMDVFNGVVVPDAFMWSSIISAHVKQGQAMRAIELYQHMQATRMKPNKYVLVSVLQACAAARDLQSGKEIHDDLLTSGMQLDMFVYNCLIDMYAKCGSLKDARRVFDAVGEKDVVTWNTMIAGYAKAEGMGQEALTLYSAMHNEGIAAPDAVTFVSLLQACANVGVSALERGKRIHLRLYDRRLEFDAVLGCSLVNMYVKCGSLEDARVVFDGLGQKNVVTWNAMICGYAQQGGMGDEALGLYNAMCSEGMVNPDLVTFVCLLQACANVGVSAIEKGKQLHLHLKDQGFVSHVVVGGSLVNMYVKCGCLKDARSLFDGLRQKNVVTWNAMISGYAQQEGLGHEALGLYSAVQTEGMFVPSVATFVCLLQACANVGMSALGTGRKLHSQIRDRRLNCNVILCGSLVNMYVKCGSLEHARIVFDGLNEKNVATWNAMIAGYARAEGMAQEALNLYNAMRCEGVAPPDAVTYVCLLEACASAGALVQGKQLHSAILEKGLESNALIGLCLVKMYAKCGCLEVSREVFDRLPIKNLVTWNALLKGYAENGECSTAIQCFEDLLEQGIQPDEVTFTCLFTACSHACMVDQAQRVFETMLDQHGIEPNDWHYNCMVDLLGRSGHLDRAEQMLRASGLADDAVSWTALLSACKMYGAAEIGRRCFDHLVNLEPTIATPYVLLGSMYANVGKWDEVDKVESLRKAAVARKLPGVASIEVKEEVREFTVGEKRSDVAGTLRSMNTRVKVCGHVPQTQLVLRAVSEEEKEDALCGHAEKLALAYGLLNTPAGSALVVTKNLRMCDDCHSSTKILSRLEKREIVVRDGHRVHRFRNGACSCQNRS